MASGMENKERWWGTKALTETLPAVILGYTLWPVHLQMWSAKPSG
jgi:hypothetical protein